MKPIVICHRGVDRHHENQIKSIKKIRYLSSSKYTLGVEFDIQISKDDHPVCFHDQTLEQFGKTANISDKAASSLRRYRIHKLIDILDSIEKNKKKYKEEKFIDIELKVYPNHSPEQIAKLCKMVHQIVCHVNQRSNNHYIITSSSIFALSHLNHLNELTSHPIDLGIIMNCVKKMMFIEKNLTVAC